MKYLFKNCFISLMGRIYGGICGENKHNGDTIHVGEQMWALYGSKDASFELKWMGTIPSILAHTSATKI